MGQTTQARLDCPPQIRSCAHATGLERATDPYETCEGGFDFVMKPYEIQAFLLRTGEAEDAAGS